MGIGQYIADLLADGEEQSSKVAEDELFGAFMERFTEDGAGEPTKPIDLQKHDEKVHGGHFDPETMTCKFREKMKKITPEDAADLIYATSDIHYSGIEDITDKECGTIVLAGDFMEKAKKQEHFKDAEKWWDKKFLPWCKEHKGQQIVIIGGNCDKWLYKNRNKVKWPENVHYLDDTETEVNGMKVYGTSWCPHNMNGAWEVDDDVLEEEFSKIPEGLDILVTHVPPKGKGLDLDHDTEFNKHFGSEALTQAILEKKPKIVLCGHVHSGSHKPIKIGDSIVMNVSRIDDDRYEKSFHGRRIGIERTNNGIGFLVDMEDEGKINLGDKKEIPESILKLRDALREAAKSINAHIESEDFKPNQNKITEAIKAIEDAKGELEKFDHPKKQMLEKSIKGFEDSMAKGYKIPMSRVGKLYEGDKNGQVGFGGFSFSWENNWKPKHYGHMSSGKSYGETIDDYWASFGIKPYKSYTDDNGKYKDPWKGGKSVDEILGDYEAKHSSSNTLTDFDEAEDDPFDEWGLPKKKEEKSEKHTTDEMVKAALIEGLLGGEVFAMDADEGGSSTPAEGSLQKHDERHHPNGFDPSKDTCKFRDKIMEEGKELEETELLDVHRDGFILGEAQVKQEAPHKQIEGLSNKAEKKFREQISKKHPELDVDLVLTEIGKIKDKTLQKDAFAWVMKGAVKLPEDMYKVEQARDLATKAKKDPLAWDTPQACINELKGAGHKVSLKPITVEELKKNPRMSDYRDEGYGVETFQVEDSKEGQKLMRKVIDTHWGVDANPWCLLARGGSAADEEFENWFYQLSTADKNKYGQTDIFTEENEDGYVEGIEDAMINARTYFDENLRNPDYEKSMNQAWAYWNHYKALPKRVAFKDGKLLAFMATDDYDVGEALPDESVNVTRGEYLKAVAPYYDEYQKANTTQPMLEWMLRNHYDALPPEYQKYREQLDRIPHIPEKWWDRQDESHEGIPVGNVPLKDDKFGRWADIEIVEGKPKRLGGYHKGEIGDKNHKRWHDNGQLAEERKGDVIFSWYANGQQDEIRDVENLKFEGWYEDGKKRFIEDRKAGLFKYWYDDGLKASDHEGDTKKGWHTNGKRSNFEVSGMGSLRWDEDGTLEEAFVGTGSMQRNKDGTYRISYVEGEGDDTYWLTGVLKNGKIQTVKQDNRTVPPERKAKVMQFLTDAVSSCLEAEKKGKQEVEDQQSE